VEITGEKAESGRGSVLGWVVPLLAAYVKDQGHNAGPILQLTGIRGRDSSGVNGMVFSDADGARMLQAADPALAAVIQKDSSSGLSG